MTTELIKKPACRTCRFFDRLETTPEEGVCRENSPQTTVLLVPQMNAITGQQGMAPHPVSCWPTVTDDLWCGRYAAKWAKLDS